VAALLARGADPGAHDARGKPPYLLAGTKAVREAFRRAMAAHVGAPFGEARWRRDGGVPGPLTDDMEDAKRAKAREKKKRAKARKKAAKKKAAGEAAAAAAKVAAQQAAEAALRAEAEAASKGAKCDVCGASIEALVKKRDAFLVGDARLCSARCVRRYRASQAADARAQN